MLLKKQGGDIIVHTYRAEILERIGENEAMVESFERLQEHLLVNNVKLQETPRILGPTLTLDPKTEQFTGPFATEANALTRRNYREPFVINDEV